MHRDTTLYFFLLGCTRVSGHISHAFLSLFKLFYVDPLLLVQVKHKRTLYRFLLSKKNIQKDNGDKNSQTQQ